MSPYYTHGKLTRDVSSNGETIRKGSFSVVSVEVDDNDSLYIFVGSGRKNVYLPFYGTDYKSLVTH